MKKIILVLAGILLLNIYSFSQTEKIKFGLKYSIKSHYFELLDDVPNHKMGVATGVGTAYMKDGKNANIKAFFIYDYTNGSGKFLVNYIINFTDSSTITLKAEGNSYGDENSPLFTANVSIDNGTGIYKGIKGKGKMSGDRRETISENAIVNLNFDLEYTISN